MKPQDPRPAPDHQIMEKIEGALRRQDRARPAGALPVWVKAALLGAGLSLAGCASDKAGEPSARDTATAPATLPADPSATVVTPPADPPMVPSADGTPLAMTPDTVAAADPTVPGAMQVGPVGPTGPAEVPMKTPLTADLGSAEVTGMLPPASGAYGAPPMQGISLGVISPSNGVAYGAPPMTGPTTPSGVLRLSVLSAIPATVPAQLRTLSLAYLRNLRSCLTVADRATPLADGGIMVRLLFSEGRLKMTTVTGSASKDATVLRCMAEAKGRLQAVTPATPSPEAKAYTKPVEINLSWTR